MTTTQAINQDLLNLIKDFQTTADNMPNFANVYRQVDAMAFSDDMIRLNRRAQETIWRAESQKPAIYPVKIIEMPHQGRYTCWTLRDEEHLTGCIQFAKLKGYDDWATEQGLLVHETDEEGNIATQDHGAYTLDAYLTWLRHDLRSLTVEYQYQRDERLAANAGDLLYAAKKPIAQICDTGDDYMSEIELEFRDLVTVLNSIEEI